jgi:hypothetical protein
MNQTTVHEAPETDDAPETGALAEARAGIAAKLSAAFAEFLAGASDADRLLLTAVLEESSTIQNEDGPSHGLPMILPVAYARATRNE